MALSDPAPRLRDPTTPCARARAYREGPTPSPSPATAPRRHPPARSAGRCRVSLPIGRSEEHTSELQSLMRISYAVFCLKKKKIQTNNNTKHIHTEIP